MKRSLLDMPYKWKIILSVMCAIALAFTLLIWISYQYILHENVDTALLQAQRETSIVCSELRSQFSELYIAASKMLLSEPFRQLLPELADSVRLDYADRFSSIDERLHALIADHRVLSGAFLLSSGNVFFSVSDVGLTPRYADMFPEGIWNITKPTMLPVRHNDITQIGDTIPVVYPLSKMGDFYYYRDSDHLHMLRFVHLLDASKINRFFDTLSGDNTELFYLADRAGTPLNINVDEQIASLCGNASNHVQGTTDFTQSTFTLNGQTVYVSVQPIGIFDLCVVHLMLRSTVLEGMRGLSMMFSLIWLAGLVVITMLCVAVTNFLMRPLRNVMQIVTQINEQRYTTQKTFKYKDEIGTLGNQINSMYDTIQQQFLHIAEKESQKAQTEIRLLSEQINAHFLYNTLECIHLKVLNGHSQAAAEMLEELGKYLRITLSVGKPMISLEKELEHVSEYMSLMNRYAADSISFSCHCDDALLNLRVAKAILQPLVENCIRHGFAKNSPLGEVVDPHISVTVTREDQTLIAVVTDNGVGFHVSSVEACARGENAAHYGLCNLSRRLDSIYKHPVQIKFTSIPFYQTSVTLCLPVCAADKCGECSQ